MEPDLPTELLLIPGFLLSFMPTQSLQKPSSHMGRKRRDELFLPYKAEKLQTYICPWIGAPVAAILCEQDLKEIVGAHELRLCS